MPQRNLLPLLAILLLLVACSGDHNPTSRTTAGDTATSPQPRTTCAELLATKCTVCHTIARICQRLGEFNKKEWRHLTDNMISRGARVSQEEKTTLVECLARPDEEVKSSCQ